MVVDVGGGSFRQRVRSKRKLPCSRRLLVTTSCSLGASFGNLILIAKYQTAASRSRTIYASFVATTACRAAKITLLCAFSYTLFYSPSNDSLPWLSPCCRARMHEMWTWSKQNCV